MGFLGPDLPSQPVPVRCAGPKAASRKSSARLFELRGDLAGYSDVSEPSLQRKQLAVFTAEIKLKLANEEN